MWTIAIWFNHLKQQNMIRIIVSHLLIQEKWKKKKRKAKEVNPCYWRPITFEIPKSRMKKIHLLEWSECKWERVAAVFEQSPRAAKFRLNEMIPIDWIEEVAHDNELSHQCSELWSNYHQIKPKAPFSCLVGPFLVTLEIVDTDVMRSTHVVIMTTLTCGYLLGFHYRPIPSW